MNNQKKNPEELNLIDYLRTLARYKKIIGLITGSAFIASIVASLLLPKVYRATASVLPPQQDRMFNGPFAMSRAGEAGSLLGGLAGLRSPAELWIGILKSRTVEDAIIERFKLKERYGADTGEETRSFLEKNVNIGRSKEDIISIAVEDKDPKRAADMANAFVEELDRINRSTNITAGQRMRAFTEKRLVETRTDLDNAENRLKVFQEKNGAVKLDDQSKAVIEAIGAIKSKQMAKEVELQTLLSYATPDNPQVSLVKTEVEELKKKLTELEKGDGKRHGIFVPTSKIPDLSRQYFELLREAKAQEALYQLLTQEYEMARIQEARDTPTIQVLDVASPPQKKFKPRRALIVLISTAAAFTAGVFIAFFLQNLEDLKDR